ncbi:cytochrome-c peroxidase [Flavitalea flava]
MRFAILLIPFLGFFLVPTPKLPATDSGGVGHAMDYFKTEAPLFAASCTALRSSLQTLDPGNLRSVPEARKRLADCRSHYKKIEAFLEYFFRNSARIYNSPPKFEPEEPFMEYQEPVGLQVIESFLYEKKPCTFKKELLQQADAVASSAADLTSLLYDFQADDKQVLESLRVELVRVMTLGITGYDAPLLKTGIKESGEALLSVQVQLKPYFTEEAIAGPKSSKDLQSSLDLTIGYLRENPGFDSFDRLIFLKEYASPLQTLLGAFIREKGLEWNTSGALNYRAANLFSPDALLPGKFPVGASADQQKAGDQQELIKLGRVLFLDKGLSGNGQRSCATCHEPGKMFTDRLPVSIAIDGHSRLDRNAPGLLYSGFQYKQFWDGRAKTLEDQIVTVLQNPREMRSDKKILNDRIKVGQEYDSLIRKAFPGGSKEGLELVATAIGAYVRSLHPMNSAFDRYMQGEENALNAREKKGANLFMGKAQCATCHFLPLFNGLIPPDYKLTEFESLGTTRSDDFAHPLLSKDPGRFSQYPLPFLKGTFKTPTVRNVALTYPYMHNGAFRSLEKVMDFYNKGGGAGLGLKVPEQTLPSTPLRLSQEEIKDIIRFLHALTDSLEPGPLFSKQ